MFFQNHGPNSLGENREGQLNLGAEARMMRTTSISSSMEQMETEDHHGSTERRRNRAIVQGSGGEEEWEGGESSVSEVKQQEAAANKERRASIQCILKDTNLTNEQRRHSIQILMDSRRRSDFGTSFTEAAKNIAAGFALQSGSGSGSGCGISNSSDSIDSSDNSSIDNCSNHSSNANRFGVEEIHCINSSGRNSDSDNDNDNDDGNANKCVYRSDNTKGRRSLSPHIASGVISIPSKATPKELLILSPSSPSSHDHNNSAVNTGNIAYSKISGGPIGNTKQLEYDRPKCPHYIRHCSIISPCCGMVFGCRLCHDEFDGQEMPFMKQMKFSSQDDEGVDGNDGDRVGSGSKKRRIEKEHDRRTNQIAAARCKSKGEMRQELKQECGRCSIGSKGQCMSCNVVKHGNTILSPPSSSSSDGSDTSTCRKGSGLPNKTRRRSSITTKKKKKNSRRFSMGSITSNVGDDVHHDINRFEIWEIICRNCFTRQSSKTNNCINCKIQFGEYHCDICNLWMESSEKPYHCNECGICRVGGREKYKHCDSCGMCIDKSQYKTHNCTAGKMMSNCPVCFEDLFSSRTACHELPCNHSIHWHCYRELSAVDIRCPICKKTTVQEKYRNELWSALREDIEAQPLPPDQTRVVDVSCTDCEFRESDRRWHPLGVDCSRCCSYNTSTDFTMVGQGAFDYLTAIEKTREGINMLDVNLREK